MPTAKGEKTKFLPVKPVDPNIPMGQQNDNFSVINDYTGLEIYCATTNHQTKKSRSFFTSMDPSVSVVTRVETETLYSVSYTHLDVYKRQLFDTLYCI